MESCACMFNVELFAHEQQDRRGSEGRHIFLNGTAGTHVRSMNTDLKQLCNMRSTNCIKFEIIFAVLDVLLGF